MQMSSEDAQLARGVLVAEYNVLISALNSVSSASLTRTSLFLGVLSAAGMAFGFASQGGVDPSTFLALALQVFVLVLFLGIATFARLVEIQRELMVYIAGMNRIRYFFQEVAPASRPYFVLPIYDDGPALYRSIGTGMRRKRPKFEILHLTVQTQGNVGIVTAVVAAGCGALVASPAGKCRGLVRSDFGFPGDPGRPVRLLASVFGRHTCSNSSTPPTPSDRVNEPF
jgi:hypothetical protein